MSRLLDPLQRVSVLPRVTRADPQRGLHEGDVDWVELHQGDVGGWLRATAPDARGDVLSLLVSLVVPLIGHLFFDWSLSLLALAVLVDIWAAWAADRFVIARVPDALRLLLEQLNRVAIGAALLRGLRRVSGQPQDAAAGFVRVRPPVTPFDVRIALNDSLAGVQLTTVVVLPLVLVGLAGPERQSPDATLVVLFAVVAVLRLIEGCVLAARCRQGTPLPPGLLHRVLVQALSLPCTIMLLSLWMILADPLLPERYVEPSGLVAIGVYVAVSMALVLVRLVEARRLDGLWRWWLRVDRIELRARVRKWRLRHGEPTLAELADGEGAR